MKTQTSAGFRDPGSAPGVQIVDVPEDRDGQRIDNFLTARLKGVPKSLVYRLLRTGQVRVNGKRAKPDHRVAAGDRVRIPPVRVAEKTDPGAPPVAQSARVEASILAEDRDFLVIDKPAGVASHGGSGVSFGAIELLRAARPRDTLELVHRLDRDTSGVLVLAKKRSALTALQAEIREGRVEKRYLSLLMGALPQQRLTVDAPLVTAQGLLGYTAYNGTRGLKAWFGNHWAAIYAQNDGGLFSAASGEVVLTGRGLIKGGVITGARGVKAAQGIETAYVPYREPARIGTHLGLTTWFGL